MGATVETLKGLIKSPEGRSIGELEHAEYNPRKIGDQALKALGSTLMAAEQVGRKAFTNQPKLLP